MSMAKFGRLGEMEFMTLLTMRTTKGLLHATATLGGTSGKDFKEAFDDWEEHYLNPFQEWAEGVLPNSPEAAPAIGRDESGYPVFPDLDPLEAQPKDLQVVVKMFLDLLYREQYSEPLPWEELEQKPENFYDMVKYQLPVPLKDPLAMGFSIFTLVTALKELDSPFRFRRYVTPRLRPEETSGEAGQASLADTTTPIPPATSYTIGSTVTPTYPVSAIAASLTATTTMITPPAPTPASSPPVPGGAVGPTAPLASLASASTSTSSAPSSAFAVSPAALPAPLAVTAASTPPVLASLASASTSTSSAPTSAFAVIPATVPAPLAVAATSMPPVPAPAIGPTAPPASLAYTTTSPDPIVATAATPVSLAAASTPTLLPPAPELPLQQSKSAKNKSLGKKRKRAEVEASTALPSVTASVLCPVTSSKTSALPTIPPPTSQPSPRKTRSARNKERGPSEASTQTAGGKKRRQTEAENSSAGVDAGPKRKKSRFWTYEVVPSTAA
ncbi:hypothetical protein EV360DRAFT_68932 [Lentinula raphanica]|nr:hypothetical protein EV360DRAFT_68932 [Lentinula raphanica]